MYILFSINYDANVEIHAKCSSTLSTSNMRCLGCVLVHEFRLQFKESIWSNLDMTSHTFEDLGDPLLIPVILLELLFKG